MATTATANGTTLSLSVSDAVALRRLSGERGSPLVFTLTPTEATLKRVAFFSLNPPVAALVAYVGGKNSEAEYPSHCITVA